MLRIAPTGTGRIVIGAALAFPEHVAEARGLELVPALHQAELKARGRLPEEVAARVTLHEADFLKVWTLSIRLGLLRLVECRSKCRSGQ